MNPSPSSEHDERDRYIISLLNGLRAFESRYPPELWTARRTAFLAQVKRLKTLEVDEGLSDGDQEIVHLLGNLSSAQAEYPRDLLAARRAALLQQMEQAETANEWDELRVSIQRLFRYKTTIPTVTRISLVLASLIAAAFLGSLFFSRTEQSFQPAPSQAAEVLTHLPTSVSTRVLPTSDGEAAILICQPDDPSPSCPPGELDPSQDLANPGNGPARYAVSKDARANPDGVHRAAYVNDGRGGASWVSNSTDSWIKIDLGQVTTINTVSLQKGSLGLSQENNPGQFVIAVALSDVYADGNSSNDHKEYAQVFDSEQVSFSGTVSEAETIRTQFAPVRARFVKITFEKAGAAIEEVGVFMVRPPVLAEQPTKRPQDDPPEVTLSPIRTLTLSPTDTAVPILTDTLTPVNTPTALPTITFPPADTATPVPTEPLPTAVPPTAVPPTAQPTPVSTDPIIITGNDQTLTLLCNGNAAEVRGHTNTITLLGSCSSITVTGNGNSVLWQHGSPVITDRGKDNIIRQL